MPKITIIDSLETVSQIFSSVTKNDFPNWNSHPFYGDYIRALFQSINNRTKKCQPTYFVVMADDQPIVLVPASSDSQTVSMLGQPLTLGLRADIGKNLRKRAVAVTFDKLRDIGSAHGAKQIKILGGDNEYQLNEVDLACIDQRATPQPLVHGVIDLHKEKEILHKQLRRSYRSLVNWGRKNIKLIHFNAQNTNSYGRDQFAKFHAKLAGKDSHDANYWNIVWNEICSGHGELSLGYLDNGTLVAGTLVIDAYTTSSYSSGVYAREMFDKPLSYYPLFQAILRSGLRGMRLFDLGEIYPRSTATEKEFQIGFFKKGFSSNFRLRNIWVLGVSS